MKTLCHHHLHLRYHPILSTNTITKISSMTSTNVKYMHTMMQRRCFLETFRFFLHPTILQLYCSRALSCNSITFQSTSTTTRTNNVQKVIILIIYALTWKFSIYSKSSTSQAARPEFSHFISCVILCWSCSRECILRDFPSWFSFTLLPFFLFSIPVRIWACPILPYMVGLCSSVCCCTSSFTKWLLYSIFPLAFLSIFARYQHK